jgi:ubiquinone/menaquinone biosynthesis C-methylase UbiE
MNLQYRMVSKFYDLIDVFYFNKIKTNPRRGILDFISNEKLRVLEICIGTAANSIVIAENRKEAEILGIDLSEEMLLIAKEKIEKRNIKNINTIIMDATNMNFQDSYFDVILISLVLHEVDENTRNKIMKEGQRVLKDTGKIIIVEWDKPKKLIQTLLFSIIELLEPTGFKEFLQLDIKEYVKQFSLKALSEKKCDYTRLVEVIKDKNI